jgi:hypothetical protein
LEVRGGIEPPIKVLQTRVNKKIANIYAVFSESMPNLCPGHTRILGIGAVRSDSRTRSCFAIVARIEITASLKIPQESKYCSRALEQRPDTCNSRLTTRGPELGSRGRANGGGWYPLGRSALAPTGQQFSLLRKLHYTHTLCNSVSINSIEIAVRIDGNPRGTIL